MKIKNNNNLFIPRFMQILNLFHVLKINNNISVTEIYKKLPDNKVTYSHVHKIIKELELYNIVSSYKKGRTRIVVLTENGIVLSKLINQMINILPVITKTIKIK